ncbi:hypothetical protein C4K27_2423 [Pseudomonas chlororaphis subsp. chlororaphis]|nr:hypothetical protein C4K27_2423 [Pseudomonas chlororaphis subsp. chlororaphis]
MAGVAAAILESDEQYQKATNEKFFPPTAIPCCTAPATGAHS